MTLCACPLDGKPDASDWPPPEPIGSGLFQQRYPGDFRSFMFAVAITFSIFRFNFSNPIYASEL